MTFESVMERAAIGAYALYFLLACGFAILISPIWVPLYLIGLALEKSRIRLPGGFDGGSDQL